MNAQQTSPSQKVYGILGYNASQGEAEKARN
jgi:hypothetical protein